MRLATPPLHPTQAAAVPAARLLMDAAGVSHKDAVKVVDAQGTFLLQTVTLQAGSHRLALRVVQPAKAPWLAQEAFALKHLEGSGLAPTLLAQSPGNATLPLPHHLLEVPTGKALPDRPSTSQVEAMGDLLGQLHAQSDVALRRRVPVLGAVSLMAAFQSLSDDVRAYLSQREKDGLPQDLLTVNLSDLMRSLRRFVVAAEHHFLPPPKRVLCHGAPEPARFLKGSKGALVLCGFERSCAGDGAQDLAALVERAALTQEEVLALLGAYTKTQPGWDGLLIPRVCAWRVLLRLTRAVTGLRELQDLTLLLHEGLHGHTAALNQQVAQAQESMQRAINGLMDFTGPARPFSMREVEAMGALIAVEELHLRGTGPVISIDGPPYTGKTPLAQELANRLRVPWVGVAAVLRAAAWATGKPREAGEAALAESLARLQVHVVQGVLQLMGDGHDALAASRAHDPVPLAPGVISSPMVRAGLAALIGKAAAHGAVVEGRYLSGILPVRCKQFLLWANPVVRKARHDAHNQDSAVPVAFLMDPAEEQAPTPAGDQVLLDGSHLSLPQLVRSVLCNLVPHAAGNAEFGTLSGRPLLFS